MRKVILQCKTKSLDEFKRLAEFSKENGITHVYVSDGIVPSLWQWHADMSDPYVNWAIRNASFFKIVVPEKLKKYIPEDYANRNFELMVKRGEILKEYGLKAGYWGVEPCFLPEEVYVDHPSWRGPRCDQPRRARKEYYSPCTDNPEVIELYKESISKLCSVVPIEYFNLMTNDSGGGMCWSERLYPGANGAKACKHIPVADKAVNFLTMIQEAAASVGVTAEVGWEKNFADNEKPAIISKLKDGQSCYNFTNKGKTPTILVTTPYYMRVSPVLNMPLVGAFADTYMEAAEEENANILFNIPSVDNADCFEFIRQSHGKMEKSTLSKYKHLHKTATALIGSKYADKLVDIWDNIDRAQEKLTMWNQGGHVFELGSIHQRWLTRPLVADQSKLTDEEKAYYRPFLFQAGTEEDAENLVNMQATIWLGGDQSRRMFGRSVTQANVSYDKALKIIDELLSKDDIGEYKSELEEIKIKIKMHKCVMTNALNTIYFQSILDRTNFEETTEDKTIVIDEQGDPRWFKIKNIIRDEIDNTYEMIDLLDMAKKPLIDCAATEEEESIMIFGPDIKNDLLKKVKIMREHSHEFDLLYRSYNL